ncbi:TetR/AcrR family transcriptional regulator [Herbidospora sp. NBRC 101105]|uniref:TetR/AcrR family transcriptional regulator n=1 Tax=Herbidospora sp. NBRC 101105 TaxID=3032195 RepID=UPI00249FB956|nr:TetR/AcrR family transcriptional regulator [Herbidospora sp. NBRC 101105]GLX95171.1 TetR family transcriptional regulator [Herbidospora sp. NBRC 101105]
MSTPGDRQRDADRTRAEILDVAMAEFARSGYAGARVDEIADLTRTTKRMIYYYFGGKEQLYIAALEKAYAEVRAVEKTVDVDHLDPVEAIRTLAQLTFDHHDAHRDFIALVAIENVHRAEHIRKSEVLANLGTPVLDLISRILDAGHAGGDFTTEADAIDVHMMISSFCFFRVANQHTFGALFGRDMTAPEHRERLRTMVGEMVVAYLKGAGR